MLKYFLTLAILAIAGQANCMESQNNNTRATCPFPFVNQYNGYTFNNCYFYAGKEQTYSKAVSTCMSSVYYGLAAPKTAAGLEDLYRLYKAYPNFYFWVGAIATPAAPKTFYWQDGSQVYPASWCSGHPKGGDNLCAFYTTTAVVGRDKCISTGPCSASVFDHGIICQYGVY